MLLFVHFLNFKSFYHTAARLSIILYAERLTAPAHCKPLRDGPDARRRTFSCGQYRKYRAPEEEWLLFRRTVSPVDFRLIQGAVSFSQQAVEIFSLFHRSGCNADAYRHIFSRI